jgi:hypothetical protein
MPSGYTDRQWKGQLCGAYEIAKFANVTKAQIAHWCKQDWFPKPVDEPRMGRIWNYQEVVQALSAKGYPREMGADGKKVRQVRLGVPPVRDKAPAGA